MVPLACPARAFGSPRWHAACGLMCEPAPDRVKDRRSKLVPPARQQKDRAVYAGAGPNLALDWI